MDMKKANVFYVRLTIACIDKNNMAIKKKVELGMVKISGSALSRDSLIKYSETKVFQVKIWKELDKCYLPNEVFVDFIKPKITKSGIMITGSSCFLRLSFKT